jgi:hypothetical protein
MAYYEELDVANLKLQLRTSNGRNCGITTMELRYLSQIAKLRLRTTDMDGHR